MKALSLDETSRPASSGYTVYGAGWCSFCRAVRLLLNEQGLHFKYIDIEAHG